MAAQAVKALPEGDEWLYEVKWDGYRALLIKDGRQVQVRSRNDEDLTRMCPTVAAAGLRLKAEQLVLDGEIWHWGPDGRAHAAESAFNVARMMGHSKSSLVDKVYAHALESGLTSAAEAITIRALGVKPQLRVIEGGQNRDARQPFDETPAEVPAKSATS